MSGLENKIVTVISISLSSVGRVQSYSSLSMSGPAKNVIFVNI